MLSKSYEVEKSRYRIGGKSFIGGPYIKWWERHVFKEDESDVKYTISSKYARNPSLLADDVYGNPVYMWLVLQYNNIVDIDEEFVEGINILLPLPSRVKRDFLNRK